MFRYLCSCLGLVALTACSSPWGNLFTNIQPQPDFAPSLQSRLEVSPGPLSAGVTFVWRTTSNTVAATYRCRFDAQSDGKWEYDGL